MVWAPTVAVMYPGDFATRVVPAGPALAGLEDAFRPHFFGGVATGLLHDLDSNEPVANRA